MKFVSIIAAAALPSLVSAHALVLASNGANGVDTNGFGVVTSTPRDSPLPGEPEQDTSIIRDNEIAEGKASACGRTEANGAVDIQSEMQKAVANGLASAAPDGTVTLTVHQVNQDGAGPFNCDVDATGTGQNFQAMEVTQNVPGNNLPFIGSLSGTTTTDFKLTAKMPAGTKCTGAGGACLVRCRNSAIAGPFGSCAAVKNAEGGSTTTAKRAVTPQDAAVSVEDIEHALSHVEARMLRSRVARLLARKYLQQ